MFFTPKKLNFKYRKILHFSLITAIVLFQVVLLFIFYNEIYNEAKLDTISKELKQVDAIRLLLDRSKNTQRTAQENLKNFARTHQIDYLDSFRQNTLSLTASMDTLSKVSKTNAAWKQFLENDNSNLKNQIDLKIKLDSVLHSDSPTNFALSANSIQLTPYNYKDVLNSIQVESTKEVDTVKKKGFFSRMGNALSGKVDVQKEKVNVLVTMKFGKEVSTGDVGSQLAKAFENTNAYYASTFASIQSLLQSKLDAQQKKEAAFAAFNLQVLNYSADLLANYEKTLQDFTALTSARFDKQYKTNKTIRNYTIIGLVILVLLISIILFFFTRLAFSYENRLYKAQIKIQQSLHFKDRIVSMISHEIRSPLSIIAIYSKFLSSKIKDKEVKEVFDSIQFTTNSLYTLSNQILEYSKNENIKMELSQQCFDLKQEFSGMALSLQTLVESNANVFVYENNFPTPCKVNSDVVKIQQLLYNAIGNANKFTTKGLIKLSCDLQEFSLSTWNLVVTIEDTGTGISKTDLARVFDNFYQGVVNEKVHNLGAGLGLNLCKELVELFHGEIQVTSEVNKGTRVCFNLILKKE
ncbi:MAG: HAMP domain-containing histidine kinase [Pseudarcicella sp.]|nr:HAMP domain-containing histidine kinase [Pseudarcicella sp.]